jgi:hypothetical protein
MPSSSSFADHSPTTTSTSSPSRVHAPQPIEPDASA